MLAMALWVVVVPLRAHAWSRMGHEIVAEIASRQLSESAREQVRALLGRRGMASVASWADEIRSKRPATRPWHFVNIPLSARTYDPARDCSEEDCIVAALERQIEILRDRGRSRAARAEALRFVIHFVGDIHQPLHCADNDDQGGNALSVRFFERKSTLHRVWDSDLLTQAGLSKARYISELRTLDVQVQDRDRFAGGGPADWANESHLIARDLAYQIPRNAELGEAYYEPASFFVSLQLLRAGTRLARVLNEALEASPIKTVVTEAQFGVWTPTAGGSKSLVGASQIPRMPGLEFGWVLRLSGASDRTVQWREELTLAGVPESDGGAQRVAANVLVRKGSAQLVDGRFGQSWTRDAGDPLGPATSAVYVDGVSMQTFRFSIVVPPLPASSSTPLRNCIPIEQCCKVCSAGQACGATCISRSYTCHVGRGCACDGVDVCR